MLGPRTSVGAGSRVLRSVLLEGAVVASGSRIVDEVVGPDVGLACGEAT